MTTGTMIRRLEALRSAFGDGAGERKLRLLRALDNRRIDSGRLLARLHESLLFLRAYPDSLAVMRAAERGLRRMASRVERLRALEPGALAALDASGVAGTEVSASFSLPVVRWLARRFPGDSEVLPGSPGGRARLDEALSGWLLPAEAEAVADGYVTAAEWLRKSDPRTRGGPPRLLQLAEGADASLTARGALWGTLEPITRWSLRDGEGSRTLARAPEARLFFQKAPLDRPRVDLTAAGAEPAPRIERCRPAEARQLADLALAAVTARYREMHTFQHADPADVLVARARDGLRIVLLGVHPRARHALRAFYGYLLVRNGVPIGYGDAVMLFEWGELNFHVFETFRGVDSARTYAAVARTLRDHFGIRYLFLNPYQFGRRNAEAIGTGAFWFYERLGFRPTEPHLEALRRRERRRIEESPAHRSSPATLRALARGPMDLVLGGDPAGIRRRYVGFHPAHVGMRVAARIESRHGGRRPEAEAAALASAMRALRGRWRGYELEALTRIAPVLELIPRLGSWPAAERRLLADVIRAKGRAREIEYLRLTRELPRFRDAILGAGKGEPHRSVGSTS